MMMQFHESLNMRHGCWIIGFFSRFLK